MLFSFCDHTSYLSLVGEAKLRGVMHCTTLQEPVQYIATIVYDRVVKADDNPTQCAYRPFGKLECQ